MAERFKDYNLKILEPLNCSVPIENESTAKILFLPYTSSESTFSNLQHIRRIRGLSFSVVLSAIKYFAFAAAMYSRHKNKPEELYLAGMIPVNMRGRLLPEEELPWRNCNLCVTDHYVGARITKSTRFWDLASTINKEFDCLLSEDNKFYMFDMSDLEKHLVKEDEIQIVNKAQDTLEGLKRHFCISNMKW